MNLLPTKRTSSDMFPEISSLRNEVEQLFDRFLGKNRLPSFGFGRKGEWLPKVDVKENEKQITVACEIPGVNAKDIDVSIKGDLLTIKGEKNVENVEDTDDYHVSERTFGSFSRTIQLPDSVDSDSIKAEQKDGLLTVTLKKNASGTSSKKIPVSAKA